MGIFATITEEQTPHQVLNHFAGSGFGPFKSQLAEALIAHVEPIGKRTRDYLDEPGGAGPDIAGGRAAGWRRLPSRLWPKPSGWWGFLPR